MGDTAIARLFTARAKPGRSTAQDSRLPGDRGRVRHAGNGPLEPIASDTDAWFVELDRFAGVPLFEDGRHRPPVPDGEDMFG